MKHLCIPLLLAGSCSVSAQHLGNYIQQVYPKSENVGQYETVEIATAMPSFELIKAATGKTSVNPYAAEEIRVTAMFTRKGDTRSWVREGFYFQAARRDTLINQMTRVNTEMPWRVRFAPPDTGYWTCHLQYSAGGKAPVPVGGEVKFHCVASPDQHGYLRVAKDKMHLEFTDGSPFFGIGQNIAWPWDTKLKGVYGHFPYQFLGGYDDYEHYFDNLADNGGNYARVVPPRWSLLPECQVCGDYSAGQGRMMVIDSVMRIAEKRGLYIQFVVQLQHGFGVVDTFDMHPCRIKFQKPGEVACDLLTNDSLRYYQERYLRYVEARWGHTPHVLGWELYSEVHQWQGYKDKNKYKDDFAKLITSMCNFVKTDLGDTLHMLSISEMTPTSLFDIKDLSFADVHKYDNDFRAPQKHFALLNSRRIRSFDKPVHFGEIGMINGPVNSADGEDFEGCNDITFHNDIWSVAFMGDFSTGCNWSQWNNDIYRMNFRGFYTFYKEQVQDFRKFGSPETRTDNGIETFYLKTDDKSEAVGWVHNRSYWWGNMMSRCRDRDGKKMFLPKDDDKDSTPVYRADKQYVVGGLERRTSYLVKYYDTRSGKAWIVEDKYVTSDIFGRVELDMISGPDFAFVLRKKKPSVKK